MMCQKLDFVRRDCRSTQSRSQTVTKHNDGDPMRSSGLTHLHALPSATGGIARLVYTRMREAGLPTTPSLSRAGLTVEQIEDRETRLTVRSQIKFLELGAHALEDDALGFHLAKDFDLREIGLLYYVLSSSETLADALHRAERYSRIANEGISLRFRAERLPAITFSYVGVRRGSDRQQIEFWLTALVRICRQLTNRQLVPSRIRLVHRRKTTPPDFRSFLGREITFGASVDEVVFSEPVQSMPIVSADRHLNELLTKYCEDALAQRGADSATLRSDLERAIAPLLPHGTARAGEVARRLGMSHRTLARRLSSEGLTFSGILEDMKADLARHYLKDEKMQITKIAWLLGYREVSAFTHAFKRWTGTAPRHSRKHERRPLHEPI
jgi:AraC-like DNA-binding protein